MFQFAVVLYVQFKLYLRQRYLFLFQIWQSKTCSIFSFLAPLLNPVPPGAFITVDKLTSALPQLGLTLHLLEEALTEDSRWAAYIRALPDSYDTVLYFTPEEVQMLRGSPCFGE